MTAAPDDGLGADLAASHPPAGYVLVHRWALDSITELHHLRAGLRHEVDTHIHPPPTTTARDLALIASELATNALLHARAPTLVELSHHQARFLLTVTDPDPGSEPQVAGPRPPGQGGFGLRIVSSLAQHVGWYRTDDAKVVWAEVGE